MDTTLASNEIESYGFDFFGENARVEKAILDWDINVEKYNYGLITDITINKVSLQGTTDDEEGNAYAKEFECEIEPLSVELKKQTNTLIIQIESIEVDYEEKSVVIKFY